MNHTTSSSTDAQVSGDCHTEIKVEDETECCSCDVIDVLLQEFKQDSQSQKTFAVNDGNSEESLTSQDVICVNSRKVTDESCSTSDNNRCPVCNKSFVTFDSVNTQPQQEYVDKREQDIIDGSVRLNADQDNVRDESDNDDQNQKYSQFNKTYSSTINMESSITCLDQNTQHTSVDNGEHRCTECKKSFTTESILTVHINLMHGEKKLKCNGCDFTTTSSWTLKLHHDSVHMKQTLEKCRYCDFSCSLKSSLALHVRAMHDEMEFNRCLACDKTWTYNVSDKLYSCEQCGYKCSEKRKLKLSLEIIHKGKNRWACGKCEKMFSDSSSVIQHINAFHYRRKPYKCIECSKTFSYYKSLTAHLSAVHDLKNSCAECGKNFSTNSYLQLHTKVVHTQEKCCTCELCDRKFRINYISKDT